MRHINWYIGGKNDCINYDKLVTLKEGYVNADNWSNAIASNDRSIYAVKKHPEYFSNELELFNELPSEFIKKKNENV